VKTSKNLADIRRDVKLFHRNALALHEAGPYAIVEVGYCGGCSFHVYVDGKYTKEWTDTLDGALQLAMSLRKDGAKGTVEYAGINGLTIAVQVPAGVNHVVAMPYVEVRSTDDPDELAQRLRAAAEFVQAHRSDRLVVEVT